MGRTGLEPVTSCVSSSGTPVVSCADTPLTTPPNGARTSACTSDAKLAVKGDIATTTTATTSSISTSSVNAAAVDDTDSRLAVLANLLADLPSPQRREVIASLPAADRVAIARLLVGGAIE